MKQIVYSFIFVILTMFTLTACTDEIVYDYPVVSSSHAHQSHGSTRARYPVVVSSQPWVGHHRHHYRRPRPPVVHQSRGSTRPPKHHYPVVANAPPSAHSSRGSTSRPTVKQHRGSTSQHYPVVG